MAADVGRVLRQLREMAQGARDELTEHRSARSSPTSTSATSTRARSSSATLLEESDDLDRVLDGRADGAGAQAKRTATARLPPSGADGTPPKVTPPPAYDGDAT